MEKPSGEQHSDPPDFESLTAPEDLVRGDRTRDDFFDAVLGLDQPATASEVAALAGRGVDAAREYLAWFKQLGIVTQITESPATYRRNQEYLNWRRVQQLRTEYSNEELLEFLSEESERERSFTDRFGVDSPQAVSIRKHAEETSRPIEEVWEDVSTWKTSRRRITLLERALSMDRSVEGQTAV